MKIISRYEETIHSDTIYVYSISTSVFPNQSHCVYLSILYMLVVPKLVWNPFCSIPQMTRWRLASADCNHQLISTAGDHIMLQVAGKTYNGKLVFDYNHQLFIEGRVQLYVWSTSTYMFPNQTTIFLYSCCTFFVLDTLMLSTKTFI